MSPRVGRNTALQYFYIAAALFFTATTVRIDSIDMNMHEANGTEDNVVLQFDGLYYKNNKDASMTITWQGQTIYSGKAINYPFKMSQLYKEYVVTMENSYDRHNRALPKCRQPIYVKAENVPGQCGINLFTAKTRTCKLMDSNDAELEYHRVKRFEPPSNRGFGIEFEFVAREPSSKQHRELVADLRENFDENVTQEMLNSEEGGVHGVHMCFKKVTNRRAKGNKNSPPKKTCERNHDCALSEYCLDCRKCLKTRKSSSRCGLCDSEDTAICHPTVDCDKRALPKSGKCPYPLMKWNWEVDKSVIPLSEEEQREIGAPLDETKGTSFEVTAPGPPNVLGGARGLHSTVQMLSALKHMGVQAGPSSGIHVHVNVLNPDAPGKMLTYAQIATVWAAYAKYQLVIDEMFTPNRVPNHYANPLFLGECEEKSDKGKCSTDPCGCNKRIFHQMHTWVRNNMTGDKTRFCNEVVRMPGSAKACTWRHPHQRYTQLNLIPLHRFGTIEFRAHSTTHEIERVARWIQFLITFVDYFSTGPGHKQMKTYFESANWLTDYNKLAQKQRATTAESLWWHMERAMPNSDMAFAMKDNKEFFVQRTFEQNDPACTPKQDGKPPVIAGSCTAVTSSRFVPAILEVNKGGQQTLKVQLPPFERTTHDTYAFDLQMPSGEPWKVKIFIEDSVPVRAQLPNGNTYDLTKVGGTFEFRFVLSEGGQRERGQTFSLTNHRCCCDSKDSCKWFPPDLQEGGHCPYLYNGDNGKCATTSSYDCVTKGMLSCKKLSHSRRRSDPKHKCKITNDPDAFFTKKCGD